MLTPDTLPVVSVTTYNATKLKSTEKGVRPLPWSQAACKQLAHNNLKTTQLEMGRIYVRANLLVLKKDNSIPQ